MNDSHQRTESVGSRYAVTLAAQIFRLLVSLVTATIVPRTLGPAVYGNYSFLLSTSAALRGVLDNGAQQAFFTFSSQERASGPLVKLYALFLGGQLLLVMTFIAALALAGKLDWLWHAQRLDQIVLVTVLDWALFFALSLQQLGDTKAQTAYPQLTGAAVSLLTLVALLALRVTGTLDFYSFVWLNLAGALLTCGTLVYRFLVRNRAQFWAGALEARRYARRWWQFARPLIFPQYYLPLVSYLGLFLIQRWYGSAEQGYYALALQWSAFAMVFTTSGVFIFWREIAHHAGLQDLRQTARVYERFRTLFFFLALALSCGLSAGSALLVQVVAGERFRGAAPVLAIMAFYPISQTINQLTAASMKATERTASYARWSIFLSVPDLLLTYLLLAPSTAALPGLQLGAVGMAIKTALYGLVTSEVYDWLNCRFLNVGYLRSLMRKLALAGVVGVLAILLLKSGGALLQRQGMHAAAALVLASAAYAAAIALMVLLWPTVAGVSREQLMHAARPFGRR
jgi:O-antigen/teichoic acid export membrane protein